MFEAENEEEQQKLDGAEVQQQLVGKDVPPEQQEWSPSLDQEDLPELPHIKEEQEELWTSQQLRGLEEADITNVTFTPVTVKSEEDDQDQSQSSQLHESQTEDNQDAEHCKTEANGEDCGESEPARNFNPGRHLQPTTHNNTSHCSEPETDDSCDWEETQTTGHCFHPEVGFHRAVHRTLLEFHRKTDLERGRERDTDRVIQTDRQREKSTKQTVMNRGSTKGHSLEEALAKLQEMSEGESDGGEVSDLSDMDWSEEETSDSEPEPPWPEQNKKFVSAAPSVGVSAPVQPDALPTAAVQSSEEVTLVSERAHTSSPVLSPCEQGKDGTIWKPIQPGRHSRKQQSQNTFTESMGPTTHAKCNIEDALSAFLCLLDRKILQHIRDCTVAEAHCTEEDRSWNLSVAELKAFIALLYVRGAYNKNIDLESFWSEEWGLAFFRTTMPRNRFREIMRYLRFDKKHDRRARLRNDKFALMSDVWDGFVKNSIACYKPGACITVDEQLFPTKARCRFTRYMANKPDKFGIKFWLAADVETKYLLNGFPYLGKDDMRPAHQHLGESVVMKLVEPYVGKGRSVTTDSFFTSLSLAKSLLQKNTSLVGTVNKARWEFPPSVQQQRGELFSTKVLKHERATLTVYQGNPRKSVAILSTRHPTVSIGSDKKRKPETVSFYNITKVTVNVLNQMARLHTVKGQTQRWPVAVFYNLLDMAAINAHILFKACTSTIISRRAFILQLAKELREEHMRVKASLTLVPMEPQQQQEPAKRRQCQVNSHCKQNKTLVSCKGCKRPVCGKCTIRVESFCTRCML